MPLIYPPKKLLILKLRDPGRVTAVIPQAKTFTHDGQEYVAVKHGVEETKVLNNLGINAPSPIRYYYNWPGRHKPFLAQHETAAFVTLNSRAFILNDMGSGKTLATLWAYDYLRSCNLVQRALIVAPLSTLERTWGDELFEHFPHLNFVVVHGERSKRLKQLALDADIYIINHDGIKVSGLVAALAERPDIDLIVIDEIAQVARNSGTDRFKALRTIVNQQHPRRAWGLTGTPTPNAPTDAWAQCRLLVPERVPPYFNAFRSSVMRQISQYLWVPRDNASTLVHEAMQPSIRFSRDECVDLPPCVFQERTVEMTPTQAKAYRDMFSRLKAEAEEGSILAVNEGVKASKLLQIACGVAYGRNGEELMLDAGPRLKVVEEIVAEAGTKVIVFTPFVASVTLIADHLRRAGYSVECIYGEVAKSERDRIFRAFQKEADPRVLVAQPAAMSHGLTLTAASTIVWYAPLPSNDIFEQANARIVRPGQKHGQLVVMLEGSDIERLYYRRLKDRQKLQGTLLDLIQESRA